MMIVSLLLTSLTLAAESPKPSAPSAYPAATAGSRSGPMGTQPALSSDNPLGNPGGKFGAATDTNPPTGPGDTAGAGTPANPESLNPPGTASTGAPLPGTRAAKNGKLSTELQFEQNGVILTATSQQKLDRLLENAVKQGDVVEVQVLTWPDQAFQKSTLPSGQATLAENRNRAIETYLRTKDSSLAVKSHNMASRPTALQELIGNADEEMKQNLREAGIAANQQMKQKLSRSTVLVVVR